MNLPRARENLGGAAGRGHITAGFGDMRTDPIYVVGLLVSFVLGGGFSLAARTCGAAAGPQTPAPRQSPAPVLKHDPSVESVLEVRRVTVGTPSGGATVPIEIEFRNRSLKAVTASEFRFRVQYPEGNDFTSSGSFDFPKAAALAAWSDVAPAADSDSNIAPGAVRKIGRTAPLGADGVLPLRVEVYPTGVPLANRSGVGDRKHKQTKGGASKCV